MDVLCTVGASSPHLVFKLPQAALWPPRSALDIAGAYQVAIPLPDLELCEAARRHRQFTMSSTPMDVDTPPTNGATSLNITRTLAQSTTELTQIIANFRPVKVGISLRFGTTRGLC